MYVCNCLRLDWTQSAPDLGREEGGGGGGGNQGSCSGSTAFYHHYHNDIHVLDF